MPRRSNAIDVLDKRAMLRMADREWQNNGLIAMEEGDAETNYMMMRFLDGYRGEFPDAIPRAVESIDQMVGNLFFSIFNTLMSQTSARDPEPVLRPSGGTAAKDDAWRRAWLNQKVVNTLLREKKFRREMDRALMSAVLSPFGMVRHGFTPDLEEYEKNGVIHARFKNQTPDLPWIQFMRPWQVRIDPMVANFDMDGEVGWIAFQNLYRSWSEIRDNPALTARDDWKPTFHYDMRPYHERKKPKTAVHGTRSGTPKQKPGDGFDMYEEWVIYDASRRTFYGVSHGSESLVREERDWPLDWGQLPASILTINEQLDSPFGIPFPKIIWQEQMMVNRIWTILNALTSRIRRVTFVNGSLFQTNEAQLENLLNPDSLAEFIVADGPVDQIANETQFSQMDGQIIGLLYQLKEQIREVLGISSFDRGQRANVETASEANQIGAGGALARSRVQGKFENFWVDVIRAAHRALLQTEDARAFFIPIIGEQNTLLLNEAEIDQGFVEASLEDLQGEFDYGIKLNSTTPLDPAAEFTKANILYTTLGGPKAELVDQVFMQKRLVTLAGEDAERVIVPQEVAQKMGEANPESDATSTPAQSQDVPNLAQVIGGGN
jgi:hypothetical protein